MTTLAELDSRLFLNVTEAAGLLQVDPRTLRRSIDSGECPHVRISGVLRIPVQKFLTWAGIDLDSSEAAGTNPRLSLDTDHDQVSWSHSSREDWSDPHGSG